MVAPAKYPPPFRVAEAIAAPSDEDPIEVGVLIVGAGPAGLACAVRLGQLMEENPDVAERLGEVPVAVVDKGKGPGSHLLSGAVMNPRGIHRLFKGRLTMDDVPHFGEVHDEAVYHLLSRRAIRLPTPPVMRNHGNYVVSVSQLARFLAEQAEEAGVTILPETAATQLLVQDGRVRGVRTGDRGRGREREELGNFEPGSDLVAGVTLLSEGTQGHLTGAAIERFGLQGANPQVWELGVKEVWKVPRPLRKVIHTLGWPLRLAKRYHEFGGSFIYPMGEDMLCIGMVIGLDYTDVELSCHDLLQELKTHPKIRKLLEGGERIEWGAKTIPGGGLLSLPKRLSGPGFLLAGDGPGTCNVSTLKGVHYAIESGRLAAEAAFAAFRRGEMPGRPGALDSYDEAFAQSFIARDLRHMRNMRPAFANKGMVMGGPVAGIAFASKGHLPPKDFVLKADAEKELLQTDRARSYPVPDGKLTFDKLSSVFLSGNKTRDDQPNHIRIETHVPREIAVLWEHMCPAQVYEVGEEDAGKVTVHVNPSNCVQCGAITAKGGRLTPPEGGSGPEYTLT